MQEKDDLFGKWKQNFNFTHALFTMHQRALTVPMRNNYGTQALGFPCLFALGLMVLWYVATGGDPGMMYWIGFWLLCLVKRRVEGVKLSGRIHSHYDGWPSDAMKFAGNEKTAKMVVEPVLVGILGGTVYWFYTENGWRPTGLPYFLLAGVVTLPFVESVKQTIWQRRIQGMIDAKLDQEMLMEEFQNRR